MAIIGVPMWELWAAVSAPAQEPRAWKIDDLYLSESFYPIAASPDGKTGAVIHNWIDPESKVQRQSLWRSAGDTLEAKAMEPSEPDARTTMFSLGGKWIVFLSTRARPEGWRQTPAATPYSEPTVSVLRLSRREF